MRKGFTLIESIVAIFILMLGILGVLSAFPFGVHLERSAILTTLAAQLVQVKIEEVISKSYSEVLCSGDLIPTCMDTEDYGEMPGFNNYKRVTKITCIDGSDFSEVIDCSPDPGLKKIEITVSWKSLFGISFEEIKIVTLISER